MTLPFHASRVRGKHGRPDRERHSLRNLSDKQSTLCACTTGTDMPPLKRLSAAQRVVKLFISQAAGDRVYSTRLWKMSLSLAQV
ncbi:MAG: hypothetical protein ACKOEZ_03210, partial [Spartobacteria bacterium]